MKHIQKGSEPPELTDWKSLANSNWTPTYDNLRGAEKKAVKEALMIEQGHICCYCERRVTDEDSHIEHFEPQHLSSVDPLNFSNMLCSCQKERSAREPLHCGALKDKWFDASLLVSPFNHTCETKFSFTVDGRIKPADTSDLSAEKTIEKLGLDIPKLRALRESAILPFTDSSLSLVELEEFVQGYLAPSASGEFSPFWTTINILFGGTVA